MPDQAVTPSRAVVTVFRLAALFTFVAVAMGSVVCATESGAACPTWPGCYPGQVAPQWEPGSLIEFTHRLAAIATGPLVLAAAVLSRRLPRRDRWATVLPWLALAGALAAGVFGRLVVLSGLPTWLGALDLTCALTAMAVMTVATIRAERPAGSALPGAVRSMPLTRLATAGAVVLIGLHVTGIFAAGQGSFTRCMGWPLWQLIDGDVHPWLQVARLALATGGAVLVLTVAVTAARSAPLRKPGLALGALFAAEMGLGLVIGAAGLTRWTAAAYSVLAVAVLWCLVLVAALSASGRVPSDESPQDLDEPVGASA